MQDHPTQDELLAALELFLDDEVVAKTKGALSFQGRVAANVVRMLRRELEHDDEALDREWDSLDALLGASKRPAMRVELREALVARNEALCERIRSGDIDHLTATAHIRQTVQDKLMVTNPAWLQE